MTLCRYSTVRTWENNIHRHRFSYWIPMVSWKFHVMGGFPSLCYHKSEPGCFLGLISKIYLSGLRYWYQEHDYPSGFHSGSVFLWWDFFSIFSTFMEWHRLEFRLSLSCSCRWSLNFLDMRWTLSSIREAFTLQRTFKGSKSESLQKLTLPPDPTVSTHHSP